VFGDKDRDGERIDGSSSQRSIARLGCIFA
jgi:hypothetical protein